MGGSGVQISKEGWRACGFPREHAQFSNLLGACLFVGSFLTPGLTCGDVGAGNLRSCDFP